LQPLPEKVRADSDQPNTVREVRQSNLLLLAASLAKDKRTKIAGNLKKQIWVVISAHLSFPRVAQNVVELAAVCLGQAVPTSIPNRKVI
jgi:hypothetical protein